MFAQPLAFLEIVFYCKGDSSPMQERIQSLLDRTISTAVGAPMQERIQRENSRDSPPAPCVLRTCNNDVTWENLYVKE